MRRAFILPVLALGFALVPAVALAASLGLGGYGGAAVPIDQDDVESGSTFGVRIPITLIPLVSVEPFFASSSLGDGTQDVGGTPVTIDGFSETEFGLHAMLGSLKNNPGFRFYPYVGIASSKLSREGSEDMTKTSYQFGLGGGIVLMPKLGFDARVEADVVDADKTRTFGNITLGLSYDLFGTP